MAELTQEEFERRHGQRFTGQMTEQQMEKIADAAAKKTVQEVFEKFGVDVNDVRSSQADFAHLRKQRLASEQVGKWALRSVVAALLSGAIATFAVGFADIFKQ